VLGKFGESLDKEIVANMAVKVSYQSNRIIH